MIFFLYKYMYLKAGVLCAKYKCTGKINVGILILTSSFSRNIGVQMYSTSKTLFSNRAQNRRQAGSMALITITF